MKLARLVQWLSWNPESVQWLTRITKLVHWTVRLHISREGLQSGLEEEIRVGEQLCLCCPSRRLILLEEIYTLNFCFQRMHGLVVYFSFLFLCMSEMSWLPVGSRSDDFLYLHQKIYLYIYIFFPTIICVPLKKMGTIAGRRTWKRSRYGKTNEQYPTARPSSSPGKKNSDIYIYIYIS